MPSVEELEIQRLKKRIRELERIKTELLELNGGAVKEIKNLRAENQQLRERIDNFLLWVF